MGQPQIQWDAAPDTSTLTPASPAQPPQPPQGRIQWDEKPDTSSLTAGTVGTGDYLSKTEDAIHSGAAFLGHTHLDTTSDKALLAAAGDQYKKTIAQAQAIHDAAAKEFKAGNYAKAVAIIAAAHGPVGLVSQAAQAALTPTHTFDPVNGLQPNPNHPSNQ